MPNILEQTFFNTFRKVLAERKASKVDYVIKGAAEDYANYRERVGEINELTAITEEYERLVKAIDPY